MDTPFCARCGQKRAERLTVSGPLRDLVHHVSSVDSSLARTLVGLTREPGETVRAYLAGNRTGYLNPAKYAFLAATLYTLVVTLFDIDVRPTQWQTSDPRSVATMHLVLGLVGYLVFLYQLPTAAVLRSFFRRSGLNFAETYTALLFYSGHLMLAFTLLAASGAYGWAGGYWLGRLIALVLLVWFVLRIYRAAPLRTLIATVVVYIVMMIGTVISGIAATLIARLWTGGWTFA